MAHYALSAVGRDRPGIVAAVSEALLAHSANIEDSQMTILRGHFTMVLVVAAPEGADIDALRADLEQVRARLDLHGRALTPSWQVGHPAAARAGRAVGPPRWRSARSCVTRIHCSSAKPGSSGPRSGSWPSGSAATSSTRCGPSRAAWGSPRRSSATWCAWWWSTSPTT